MGNIRSRKQSTEEYSTWRLQHQPLKINRVYDLIDLDINRGGELIAAVRNLSDDADERAIELAVKKVAKQHVKPFLYEKRRGAALVTEDSYKDWYNRLKEYAEKEGHIKDLFKQAEAEYQADAFNVYQDHDACTDLIHRGWMGETPFLLCFLMNTEEHIKVAKALRTLYPKLVLDVYEGREFFGESALHIAVAHGRLDLVEYLLERDHKKKLKADIHQRATGRFFRPDDQKDDPDGETDYKGATYLGEYPLSFAASKGDIGMYRFLLSKGANPNKRDSFGNTVLHMAVIHDQPEMLKFAVDPTAEDDKQKKKEGGDKQDKDDKEDKDKKEKEDENGLDDRDDGNDKEDKDDNKDNDDKEDRKGTEDKKDGKDKNATVKTKGKRLRAADLYLQNKQKLTPLTLASKLGRDRMFRLILELGSEEVWQFGAIKCMWYPLPTLDSITEDGETANLGEWAVPGFLGEMASRAGLALTNPMVKECREGGFPELREEGKLYLVQTVGQSELPAPASTQQCEPASSQHADPDPDDESVSRNKDGVVKWSHSQILLLLDEFRQRSWMMDDPSKKQAQMWKEIASAMTEKGHEMSPEHAKKKWDNMKSRFKIIKDKNGKTGRGRSSWPYFDLMDDILRGDPSITPRVTVSSLSGTTNGRSALSLMVEGDSDGHLEIVQGDVVNHLLEAKWKAFGRKRFVINWIWACLHLIVLSTVIYMRPHRDPLLAYTERRDGVRFAFEIVLVLSCVAKLVLEGRIGYDICRSQGWKGLLKHCARTPAQTIFLIACLLIVVCVFLRGFRLEEAEDSVLMIAVPGSWFYLLFFASGFKMTGPFVVMIYKMVTGDLFRFGVIYIVFFIGFTTAFFILFLDIVTSDEDAQKFLHIRTLILGLFQMTFGDFKYEALDLSHYPVLAKLVFFLFMIIMSVLLLQMLIAMMANTYSKVIQRVEKEWRRQWATTVLVIERGTVFTKKSRKESQAKYSEKRTYCPRHQYCRLPAYKDGERPSFRAHMVISKPKDTTQQQQQQPDPNKTNQQSQQNQKDQKNQQNTSIN